MELFSFPNDVLTSYTIESERALGSPVLRGSTIADHVRLNLAADRGSAFDLSNQFVVFHLNPSKEGAPVLSATQVEPKLEGSYELPDVLVSLEMLSFQIGASEAVSPDDRATIRLTL